MKFLLTSAGNTKISIDDDTAIKVVDNSVEIVSEGQWKKFK